MAEDPENGGEKTEDASSRKLSKAREDGQVAKSIEIPSVFVLLAGAISLYASAFFIYKNLISVFHFNFNFTKIPLLTDLEVIRLLAFHTQKIIFTLMPVMLPIFIVALLANFAQVGFVISWKSIEPKLSKLDPINGFKQKFSSRAVIEFLIILAICSIV